MQLKIKNVLYNYVKRLFLIDAATDAVTNDVPTSPASIRSGLWRCGCACDEERPLVSPNLARNPMLGDLPFLQD